MIEELGVTASIASLASLYYVLGSRKEVEVKLIEDDGASVHKQIEEHDKEGRELFKAKKHIEAASIFSKAILLIEGEEWKKLQRQWITLMNNRAAMYEKAGMKELAMEDCEKILEVDVGHVKCRLRKLRILEGEGQYKINLLNCLKFCHSNTKLFLFNLLVFIYLDSLLLSLSAAATALFLSRQKAGLPLTEA